MRWLVILTLIMVSCGDTEQQTITTNTTQTNAAKTEVLDTAAIASIDTASQKAPIVAPVKKPSGIYQFVLPYKNDVSLLHTISFKAGTFQLQEEYAGDSTVTAEGTWSPSQGFIWLYQGHVVRGRYSWQGDTLQYFSPRLNKKFSMTRLTPVTDNPAWQIMKKEGAVLYGVGTEPFWSVEIKSQDSIVVSMPQWTEPLRISLTNRSSEQEGIVYSSATDSLQLIVSPYFCNDGMSDFVYSHKLTLQYKGHVYKGCGVVF